MSDSDITRKSLAKEEARRQKNARSRQRYAENKDQILAYHASLYQTKKSTDPEFLKNRAEKSAKRREENPEITRASNAKRRASNPDAERARCREWFAANPEKRAVYEQNRRAKKKSQGGMISPTLKTSLFVLQMGLCACCRKKFSIADFHMDHVMPLSKGGAHANENIQLLCQPCNQAKYSKHPIDFMQERGFLL